MLKIEINGKKYEGKIPVRIFYNDKEYWIKRATKTDGIYLNNQPPTEGKENVFNNDRK